MEDPSTVKDVLNYYSDESVLADIECMLLLVCNKNGSFSCKTMGSTNLISLIGVLTLLAHNNSHLLQELLTRDEVCRSPTNTNDEVPAIKHPG